MFLRPRPVTLHSEEFHVHHTGTTLLLKLCGFIDDQQARLASVDENHVEMDFGPRWWWQSFLTRVPRFRLRLTFQEAQPDDLNDRQNQLAVAVALETDTAQSSLTDQTAWWLLWKLRSHLMVAH